MRQADGQRLLIKVLTLGLLAVSLSAVSSKTPDAPDSVFARQAPVQAPVISVASQAGAPLRISAVNFDGLKQGAFTFSVTNISEKPISAYAIRQDVEAGERNDSSALLFDLGLVNSTLSPQHSATRADTFRPLAEGTNYLSLSVDYVEFTDGTRWGGDSFKSAEQVEGQRAGARLAADRLIQILNAGGSGAVLEAIDSGAANVAPPPGHSAKWAEGYRRGGTVVSARLKDAFKKGGAGQLERELRNSSGKLDGRK